MHRLVSFGPICRLIGAVACFGFATAAIAHAVRLASRSAARAAPQVADDATWWVLPVLIAHWAALGIGAWGFIRVRWWAVVTAVVTHLLFEAGLFVFFGFPFGLTLPLYRALVIGLVVGLFGMLLRPRPAEVG